jgi:hypothetical protein
VLKVQRVEILDVLIIGEGRRDRNENAFFVWPGRNLYAAPYGGKPLAAILLLRTLRRMLCGD